MLPTFLDLKTAKCSDPESGTDVIELLNSVPRRITVATSGGVDSQVLLDFLKNNHDVDCAFFHHGTENSEKAHDFLTKYCANKGFVLRVGNLQGEKPSYLSAEEWWRDNRYKFFSSIQNPIAVAHTLDDVVETWIWSSLHGQSSLMPYSHANVIRPLLLTRKHVLLAWAEKHGVPWMEDSSNQDTKYTRNFIRHELLPGVLRVNPGIHSMIKKKLTERKNKMGM